MKELIAALRGEKSMDCKCSAHCAMECGCSAVWPESVAAEAADAIERLTAENAKGQDIALTLLAERDALAAQVVAMREALVIAQSQVAVLGGTPDPDDPYCDQIQVEVQLKIRTALAIDSSSAESILREWDAKVAAEEREECAAIARRYDPDERRDHD